MDKTTLRIMGKVGLMKMTKKRFLFEMLVMVLVFVLAVVGCDNNNLNNSNLNENRVAATYFTITPTGDFSIAVGETRRLAVSFMPAGSTGTVTWTSSAIDVATVSDTGIVTGVAAGTANITGTLSGVTPPVTVTRTVEVQAFRARIIVRNNRIGFEEYPITRVRIQGAYQIFCVNDKISLERNPFFSKLNGELV